MINETEKLVSTFEEEMQKMRSIQEIVETNFSVSLIILFPSNNNYKRSKESDYY